MRLRNDTIMWLAVIVKLMLIFFYLLCLADVSVSTQANGVINYSDSGGVFVRLIARYGAVEGQSLYMYGNSKRTGIVDVIPFHSQMLLAFMPQDVWNTFYPLSERVNTVSKCNNVVKIAFNNSIAVSDQRCETGERDLIRKIPCDSTDPMTCNQPINSTSLVKGSNFTYRIESNPSTQFYYLALVACTRNSSASAKDACTWEPSEKVNFRYNFHIVNSDPDTTLHFDPFDYEFPYNFKGILIAELIFTALYLCLLVVHCIIHSNVCNRKDYRMHTLPRLFTASLVFEVCHVAFEMIHYSVYAHDGQGVIAIRYIGALFNQFSDVMLISVLLLVGKGWQVTTASLRWKKLTFAIWSVYVIASAVYFSWMVIQEQVYPLSSYTTHPYQSWAGGLYLSYRLFLLLYILYEMRQIYLIENRPFKLKLYVCFAVCYIVWFCSTPLMVFIAALVNPVERFKILSISVLVFDFLLNCGVLLLFCPKWSNQYFQFESHINQLHESSQGFKSLKTYGADSNSYSRLV